MVVGIPAQPGQGAVVGKPLDTPAAWLPANVLAKREEWTWVLSPTKVDELIAAAKHAVATGKKIPVGGEGLGGPWREGVGRQVGGSGGGGLAQCQRCSYCSPHQLPLTPSLPRV